MPDVLSEHEDDQPMDARQMRGVHGLLVERLGRAIADGRLAGRLDPVWIAGEFRVSRSVVREGLRVLEAKGMVQARQRHGTHVTSTDHWSLLDPDVIFWRILGSERMEQLRDAFELRQALEPLGARTTASRGDADALAVLTDATHRLGEAARRRDIPAMIEADADFHSALLRGSGNRMLARLASTVGATLRVAEFAKLRRITPDVVERHAVLVRAIRARDPEAAVAESLALVEYSRDLIETALRRTQRDRAS